MKKIILLSALVFTLITAEAQIKISDFQGGKHYHNTLIGNIEGKWVRKDSSDSFQITIKKSTYHLKQSGFDANFDELLISVSKFMANGKDVGEQFTAPIELVLTTEDRKQFRGRYRDPITKNNVEMILKQVSEKEFTLHVQYPEVDITNNLKNGTVFPKSIVFVR